MTEIVGTKEMSEITGLSEGQIRSLARTDLPSHRVGGRLAFEVTEALAWLENAGLIEADDEGEDDDIDEEEDDRDDEEGEDFDDAADEDQRDDEDAD